MLKRYKKITFIGLVLTVASVVISAITPPMSVRIKSEGDDNGTLRAEITNTLLTCIKREGAVSCNATTEEYTTTTGAGQGDSFTGVGNTEQTNTNTSMSALGGSHPGSSVV